MSTIVEGMEIHSLKELDLNKKIKKNFKEYT